MHDTFLELLDLHDIFSCVKLSSRFCAKIKIVLILKFIQFIHLPNIKQQLGWASSVLEEAKKSLESRVHLNFLCTEIKNLTVDCGPWIIYSGEMRKKNYDS